VIAGLRVLAVVPARSGSKGIADKNMCEIGGRTLIAIAGDCLAELAWIDRRVISTDSDRYAEEGQRHGLTAPFRRPDELSSDRATAIDAMRHALHECERIWNERYDVFVLVEPTSPFRLPADIEQTVNGMVQGEFDSAICVSPANSKAHPLKMLERSGDRLGFYDPAAATITARQQLEQLYVRNGACYAIRRDVLLKEDNLINDNTYASVVRRELVNIDEPIDLEWAEFLLHRHHQSPLSQ